MSLSGEPDAPDCDELRDWWRSYAGPDGIRPPEPGAVPAGMSCDASGFVLRHADRRADELAALTNVGPMTRGDFAILGIGTRRELARASGSGLYVRLQRLTGLSIDPCQHDVMLAAVAEAIGGPPEKWWAFTARRKAMPDLRLPRALERGR